MTQEERLIRSVEHYAKKFNITDEDTLQSAYLYVLERKVSGYPHEQSRLVYIYFKNLCKLKGTRERSEKRAEQAYAKDMCNSIRNQQVSEYLHNTVDTIIDRNLTPRQAYIVRKSFGLDGCPPMSYEDIGEELSLTGPYTQQILCKALRRIRMSKYGRELRQLLWEVSEYGLC